MADEDSDSAYRLNHRIIRVDRLTSRRIDEIEFRIRAIVRSGSDVIRRHFRIACRSQYSVCVSIVCTVSASELKGVFVF